ncbi:MAG TPA: hypothetical protein VGO68_22330 [Pyrinomonadaceae bacterium]|jgi:hypothetical protein|nr:hypothetical protein [Pyrinomonadaceae bacterium]
MKSSAHKVVALFFIIGLGCGLVSAVIASLSSTWGWLGLGVILSLALFVGGTISSRLQWISLNLSLQRVISAALIIAAAYPLSALVMIIGQQAYEAIYAKLFPAQWHERVYSGAFAYTKLPLYLATLVAAVLVSSALRVLTRKWDKQVILLLMIAGILTIPLSQSLAALIGEPNWHLILFPIGEALFGALCGYWLVRAVPVQAQPASSAATAGDPDNQPA